MEPALQRHVFCHAIHSAHTLALVEKSISLWLDNKTITLSPPGSRQSNSGCTKLHIPQSGKKRATQKERERERERKERKDNRQHSSTGRIKKLTHKHSAARTPQTHTTQPSELNVVCVQHNLLDSHDSESNILLRRYRPPASDAVRMEHQPEHAF